MRKLTKLQKQILKETKYWILAVFILFFIPTLIIDSFLLALLIFLIWIGIIVSVQGDAFFHKDTIWNQRPKVAMAMLNPLNRREDIDKIKKES